MQIRVYSEPGSNPLLEKMRLVCGQRTADKEKGGKRDFAERRRHCLCFKAVGCQLGSVRALPFSQDTFLPALPAVLKQRAAKVLISGIDWGRAGHLRSDRGRYPRAEHNLGQGGHRGAGLYPLLLLPGGENSPQAKLCKHGKRGCESEHPHRQGELAETQRWHRPALPCASLPFPCEQTAV